MKSGYSVVVNGMTAEMKDVAQYVVRNKGNWSEQPVALGGGDRVRKHEST